MVRHFNDLKVEDQVMVMLEQVIDPEIGIDLVNLGLIYDVKVENDICHILMTLTTPNCPLLDVIEADIQNTVTAIESINEVKIEYTFEPRWTPDSMSRYARIALGI